MGADTTHPTLPPPRPPIHVEKRKRTSRCPSPSPSPSPSPASRAAVCAQKAVHYGKSLPTPSPALTAAAPSHADTGRAGPSPVSEPPRSRGPAVPWPHSSQRPPCQRGKRAPSPLSAPPRSRGKGASLRPLPFPLGRATLYARKGGTQGHTPPLHIAPALPAGARRTAGPPQSPSAQATPAQPHAPRLALPAYARGGTVCSPIRAGHASPSHALRPARVRKRTDGTSTHARGGMAHTAQSSSARATPPQPHAPRRVLPSFARGGTARPPLRVGHASRPRTQGGGSARPPPPHGLRQRRLRTLPRPRTRGDARGPAQPPPRGVCYLSPPGGYTPRPRRDRHAPASTYSQAPHLHRTHHPQCHYQIHCRPMSTHNHLRLRPPPLRVQCKPTKQHVRRRGHSHDRVLAGNGGRRGHEARLREWWRHVLFTQRPDKSTTAAEACNYPQFVYYP
ncbi:hypothetical protein EDB83DRAFT_2680059 [Lactarius deliciosus]|nr:hypothetical protein EDB83DRAFT_2680059 [Lactarius deliciosus]